jgi:hypothetical protein
LRTRAAALVAAGLEPFNGPTDAVGRLLFNVLAMVAQFESDLIRLRTIEGMKVAEAKGRLRGKQPKLNPKQEAHLVSLEHSGEYKPIEVAELVMSAASRPTAPSNGNASRRRRTSQSRPHGAADDGRRLSRSNTSGTPSPPAPAWQSPPKAVSRAVLERGHVFASAQATQPADCRYQVVLDVGWKPTPRYVRAAASEP